MTLADQLLAQSYYLAALIPLVCPFLAYRWGRSGSRLLTVLLAGLAVTGGIGVWVGTGGDTLALYGSLYALFIALPALLLSLIAAAFGRRARRGGV